MGMKILFLGGYRDGEEPVYTLATAYHQGYPLKMRTDHTVDLCISNASATDDGYLGLALNFSGAVGTMHSDLQNGKAPYLAGYNKVKLDNQNEVDASDTYPYDTALTYDEGQELYVDTNGKLANSAPGAGNVPASSIAVARIVEVGLVVSTIATYLVVNTIENAY